MSEIDVHAECQRLLFYQGAAYGAADERTRAELWKLLPFIKALTRVAGAHEQELLAAWKEALVEPMPFGCEPVGLPEQS